jgi:hypothetical protein
MYIYNVKIEIGSVVTPWVAKTSDAVSINNLLTSANVSTYINPGAIGNTQIGGDILSSNWVGSGGTAGWYLDRNGNFYANSGTFKGNITGASGTFSGSLSGENITGATGTFSGGLTAAFAQVGTLNIAGNAATICQSGESTGGTATVSFTLAHAADLQMIGTAAHPTALGIGFYLDGAPYGSSELVQGTAVIAKKVSLAAGYHTFQTVSGGVRASIIVFASIR